MCGIAGIVGVDALQHRGALDSMLDAMEHRGPDDRGILEGPSGSPAASTVLLGHRRLSIIDLSASGHQPMSYGGGDFTIVYNGEIYNFPDLKEELMRRGYEFATTCDTEVLLAAYSEWGLDCFHRLDGMFALALWDRPKNSLVLARDRFGQKPLYHTVSNGVLLFASEVRALLASGLVARRLNSDAVVAYLSYGAVHGDATIVDAVYSFPPGSYCEIDLEKTAFVDPRQFWNYPREKESLDADALREEFADAVRRHMISDAPVGIFLSGGIDSSAVAAAAVKVATGVVKTLAVTYPEQPDQCEGVHARRVAESIGTSHVEIPITGSALVDLLSEALHAMDQPTIDGINTYIVSYAAREAGFKVALSGLGADELFGGYRGHFTQPGYMLRLRKAAAVVRTPLAKLLAIPESHRQLGKLADLMHSPGDLLSAYLIRRKLFSSAQVAQIMPVNGENGAWHSGLAKARERELSKRIEGRDYADAIGILEMSHYMGEMLLRDTDSMGMGHSIEIRVPFLDNPFSHHALCLEADARVPSDIPKHRFVEAIRGWLPIENILRPKQGFRMPFNEWMQAELKEEVNRGIGALAERLDKGPAEFVRDIWNRFLRQPAAVGWSRPWALFVLGRYIDQHRLHR